MSKLETTTNSIIKNSLEIFFPGGFYFKPPDAPPFDPRNKGAYRFTIKRPFDIMYYWKGLFLAIETKAFKVGNLVRFADIKEHQIKNLLKVAENGGNAYVAINVYEPRLINRIYFIDVFDFIHWSETADRKSINETMLNLNAHVSFYLDVESIVIKSKRYKVVQLKGTFIMGG